MTGNRRFAVVFCAALFASCGPPLMKLPAGPGAPAPDAADILNQATAACRNVRALTAEVAVSGSVGGRRIRARLSAGVAAPASARLEAVAPFGQPLFIFVATGEDATLLLPRDQRVLEHGRPEAVLEALAGIPLNAAELRATLSGCPVGAVNPQNARQLGDDWRVVADSAGGEIYLHRDNASAPWRLVAAIYGNASRKWRAEYRDFQNDLPRIVRLASINAPRSSGFDLQLVLSQVEINVPLDPEVFRVQIPRSFDPISIDELRRSGPLSGAPVTNGR